MSIQGSVNQLLNISAIGLGAVQKQQYGQLQSKMNATLKGVGEFDEEIGKFEPQGPQGDRIKQTYKDYHDYYATGAKDLEKEVDTSGSASIHEIRQIRKDVDEYDKAVTADKKEFLKQKHNYKYVSSDDALLRAQKEVYGRNETAERMQDRIKEVQSMYKNILKEDTE